MVQLAVGKPIDAIAGGAGRSSALNLDRRAITEPRRRIGEDRPEARVGQWRQRIEPAMSTPPSVTDGAIDNRRPPSSNVAARPERIPTAAPMMMSVA